MRRQPETVPVAGSRTRRAGLAARAGVAGRRLRRDRLHRAEPLRDRHAARRRRCSSPPACGCGSCFMPLLLLIAALNVGYSIGAIPAARPVRRRRAGSRPPGTWRSPSSSSPWSLSEDTTARLDMLRRGLMVGAMIASLAAIAGYFNLVPGGHDLLTLYERARGTFKDPNVLGAFLILPALFALQSVVSDALRQGVPQHHRLRHHVAGDPARLLPRRLGRSGPDRRLHAGADGADQPHRAAALAHRDHGTLIAVLAAVAADRGAAVIRFHRRDVQAARELRPEL